MEGLESTDKKMCEIHHTPLINGQCVVCNRDEDRAEVAETSSRGWRDADTKVPQQKDSLSTDRHDSAGGKDEGVSGRTFRELFTEGVREQLGDSPLAKKILERQKPAPAREDEPRHRAAHVRKKKLR